MLEKDRSRIIILLFGGMEMKEQWGQALKQRNPDGPALPNVKTWQSSYLPDCQHLLDLLREWEARRRFCFM
jgi:hypothetical protein